MPELSEAEILSRYRKIREYALRLTGDEDDAKDLTQDSVILALQKRHLFLPDTNLTAWLKAIIRNIFINQYRKRQKFGAMVDVSDIENGFGIPEEASGILGVQHIEAALLHIPERNRRCLTLRAQGYKYDEIAEIEKICINNVRTHIHRGRLELVEKLRTTTQPI